MRPCKLAKIGDIAPGKARKYTVDGKEVAVFNVDGKFFAIDDTCAHLGASLSEGALHGQNVTCPAHDWTYDVTSGQEIYNEGAVACYKTCVEGDDIVVEIG